MDTLDDVVGPPDFRPDLLRFSEEKFKSTLGLSNSEMDWLRERVQTLISLSVKMNRPALLARLVDDEVIFILFPPDTGLGGVPRSFRTPFPNPDYFDSDIGFVLANQVVATKAKQLLMEHNAVTDLGLLRLFTSIYSLEEAMSEEPGAGIAYYR